VLANGVKTIQLPAKPKRVRGALGSLSKTGVPVQIDSVRRGSAVASARLVLVRDVSENGHPLSRNVVSRQRLGGLLKDYQRTA
jgi:hypothetical protein